MTTIRFGAKCDGPGSDPSGCSVAFNNYDTGTIASCADCGEDFCPSCVKITGHAIVIPLGEERRAALACPVLEAR